MSHQEFRKHRRWVHRSFRIFVILLLLGGAAFFALKYWVIDPIRSPAQRLADALAAITEQKIEVNGHTITLASSEVRELVVIKRRTKAMVEYKTKWMGSEKQVILVGTFQVKAGFKLDEFEGFELKGNEVVGEWPEPRLLALDLQKVDIFFSKSGVLNKLSDDDYERATNLLIREARREAIFQSGILEEADRIIQTRLEDRSGGRLDFKNLE